MKCTMRLSKGDLAAFQTFKSEHARSTYDDSYWRVSEALNTDAQRGGGTAKVRTHQGAPFRRGGTVPTHPRGTTIKLQLHPLQLGQASGSPDFGSEECCKLLRL